MEKQKRYSARLKFQVVLESLHRKRPFALYLFCYWFISMMFGHYFRESDLRYPIINPTTVMVVVCAVTDRREWRTRRKVVFVLLAIVAQPAGMVFAMLIGVALHRSFQGFPPWFLAIFPLSFVVGVPWVIYAMTNSRLFYRQPERSEDSTGPER